MTRSVRLLVIALALGTAWLGHGTPELRAQPRPPQPGAAQPAPAQPGAAQPAQPSGPAPQGEDATGDPAAPGDGTEGTVAPDQEALDIDALRQEYLRLRDELFRSRARAAAVASALYSTRLRIHLDHESARFYTITRSTVHLDGANVYDDTSGAIGADRAVRFEGFVAPGSHRVGVRIEATGKDDERFTTVIDNAFTLEAPAGKDVIVRIRARDTGNIPYAWQKKQRGSYKLALDVAVETVGRQQDQKEKASASRPPAGSGRAPIAVPLGRVVARAGRDP
jgi:hypothetical protein